MSVFGKIIDFVSGGIGGTIVEAVAAHFPPDMSEKEREEMKIVIAQAAREYELELLRVAHMEQEEFNKRIKELEGTASDLNQAGGLGKVVLFLRGLQRPAWGFGVLVLDFMVFSGSWPIPCPAEAGVTGLDLQSAFWVINFLVLGFLFGERAMRNVMPFFQARMGAGQAPATGSRTDIKPVG